MFVPFDLHINSYFSFSRVDFVCFSIEAKHLLKQTTMPKDADTTAVLRHAINTGLLRFVKYVSLSCF